MVAPFYQDSLVTIYNADCRDLLESLAPFEIVITDPPYGIEYHSGHYKYGNPHSKLVGDGAYPVDVVEKLLLARRRLYLFCRWDNIAELPKPKSVIVWAKNNWSAGDLEHAYGRMWEACMFYPGIYHQFTRRPADVIYCDRVAPAKLLHPTEKPTNLISKLISDNVGGSVLDPFMGSGSTLVAAKQHGRKAIGIEIDRGYCEIAVERLLQTELLSAHLTSGSILTGGHCEAAGNGEQLSFQDSLTSEQAVKPGISPAN
jgi:site-specific DNA-methyltransferase (adenine-specific)